MKTHIASLINAITLMLFGLWAYLTSETSMTALIPVFIGGVLLILNPGVKKEAKIPAHVAVLLTLIIFIGLMKPLIGALERSNTIGIVRVSVMLFSTALALVSFIRNFIDVRNQRKLDADKDIN